MNNTKLWPTIKAHDSNNLVDFLVNQVGFEKTSIHEDAGVITHAQLDWPNGGGIMVGSIHNSADWDRQPGTAGIYLVTDQVVELHQKLSAAGATVIQELNRPEYGGETFAISDPEGNYWSFGNYSGEDRHPT